MLMYNLIEKPIINTIKILVRLCRLNIFFRNKRKILSLGIITEDNWNFVLFKPVDIALSICVFVFDYKRGIFLLIFTDFR